MTFDTNLNKDGCCFGGVDYIPGRCSAALLEHCYLEMVTH